ncbi:MAG: ribonuclease H-like domain-containing protein [Deltaproteobacteria bacterium]|nr:ribonuclease H-like domain-containing protein [Deltaproteobacteria bacterium]MBW2071636.1 ribonuclease H-like domain-containing protein [Deltaproteobacteria bacterium]
MLEHTFIHLPFIGPRTEVQLWRQGILTWEDLNHHLGHWPKCVKRREAMQRALEESWRHRQQPTYFHSHLPSSERWRLYGSFRHSCAFLDIETTGLSSFAYEISVIGIFDGLHLYQFVNGRNLEEFEEVIYHYDLLVTFNGSRFDLPFITASFPNFRFQHAHIDLRFVLHHLGIQGGLKKIEPLFGIHRHADIRQMGGYEAVLLWQEYLRGSSEALERLLLYNRADVLNLQTIMEAAYERLLRRLESRIGKLLFS